MGCFSSAPIEAPEPNVEASVEPEQKVHEFSNVVVTSPTGITRQVTITLSSDDKDDILISKVGDHYVIQGTRIVVNMNKCTIVGYLDAEDKFHNKKIPHVETMCNNHDMDFEVIG